MDLLDEHVTLEKYYGQLPSDLNRLDIEVYEGRLQFTEDEVSRFGGNRHPRQQNRPEDTKGDQ